MSSIPILSAIRHAEQQLAVMRGVEVGSLQWQPPASEADIDHLTSALGFVLPNSLRTIFTEEATRVEFAWRATEGVFGRKCSHGHVRLLSPDEVARDFLVQKREAQAATKVSAPNNEGFAALAADWPFWLPVFRFKSGDCFCLDTRFGDDPAVVFLEHDVMDGGPSVHGLRIAPNLSALLQRWPDVLFVELQDWTDGVDSGGLNPNAQVFDMMRERLQRETSEHRKPNGT